MKVLAAPGLKCPKETNHRDYIDDKTPFDAPDTSYYRRLVADGSLVKVPDAVPQPAKSKEA
jgi:hypothetical protein